MKRFLLILLISLVVTSCVTEQKCNQKFPPKTIIKDSIIYKETVKYRDTTIYKTLVKDSIVKETEIKLVNDTMWFKRMFAYGRYGWAEAYSLKGKAYLDYHEGGMNIEFRLDNVIKERDKWIEAYNSKEVTKTIKENTSFARFAVGFFWAIVAIILLGGIFTYLFVRFKK